jgi:hypothetical protein
MRGLGSIQRDVVAYLTRCGEDGGAICCNTTAEDFRGYDWEQVERAVTALIRRRIVRRDGIRYIVNRR